MKQRPFWFLLNIYGWIIIGMSFITAIVIRQWWVVLLGIIGYQIVLLVEILGGRSLGRTGAVRLARAEQENRELRAEQARLIGAIDERDQQIAVMKTQLDLENEAEATNPEKSGNVLPGN